MLEAERLGRCIGADERYSPLPGYRAGMKRLSLAFVFTLACSGEQTTKPSGEDVPEQAKSAEQVESPEPPSPESKQAEPLAPKDGSFNFFMAEGAPEPKACTVAAECMSNTIPDLDNPCCQNPRTLEPYAKAYWAWIGQWREGHCQAVDCPPPPAPARPPACSLELDCIAGACVDACPRG